MKKTIVFYAIIFFAVSLNIFVSRQTVWVPDLPLLVIIFVSIYGSFMLSLQLAFFSGILQGILSVYMMPVYLLTFPMASLAAYVMSKMLNKYNPVVQIVISTSIIFFVIIMQVLYLSSFSEGPANVAPLVFSMWRGVVTTIIFTPLIFMVLRKMLGLWKTLD